MEGNGASSVREKKKKKKGQVHCDPVAETRFSYLCHLGSSFSVHVYHSRGVLPVYWACKVFSGSKISCGARKLTQTPQVIKK